MSKTTQENKKKAKTVNPETSKEKKSSKINFGKCCRCTWRKSKACTCKKSDFNTKFVARKNGCNHFSYAD